MTIEQPGGLQHVVWSDDNHVFLDTAPRVVFTGEMKLADVL